MKIISLQSENVKRIKAVEITPDGNIVKITGKNGEGKTSVLDSILWALAGKEAIQSMPIRKGAERANIKLDLGDYKIERSITAKGAYIKVTTKDGASYPSPQKLLDSLVGKLSFDPMAFTRMKAAEQGAVLRDLAGLDLTTIDTEESQLTDQRRDAKREAERTAGILAAAGNPEEAPEALQSAVEINEELQGANEKNQELATKRTELASTDIRVDFLKTAIIKHEADIEEANEDTKRRITELRTELESKEREAHKNIEKFQADISNEKAAGKKLAAELNKSVIVDTEEIKGRLAAVETNNEAFRARKLYLDAEENSKAAGKIADGLEEKVQAVRTKRKEMIVTADYPLEGLTISDAGTVIYNDIPVDQISLAEQIRVSTSIAIALNPNLRVIRITDGSLLDTNSMEIIAGLATDNDYQVWIEMVDETGKVGFYIEDGQLAAIDGKKVDNGNAAEEKAELPQE